MLPLTKSQPKEMLPVFNKPAIQYVVEEAIDSGIDDILIITGKGKRAIEDHFSPNPELEGFLRERGREEDARAVRDIGKRADIFYVRQKEPKGLGDAVRYAEKHVGRDVFAVLLGDDIILNEKPAIKQLIDAYRRYDAPVLGVEKVRHEEVSKYGIIAPGNRLETRAFEVEDLVEKPDANEAPSDYAIVGRYLLTPEIFTYLRKVGKDSRGEIQLTDALRTYNKEHRIIAFELEGRRIDIGSIEGWIAANIEYVREHRPDILRNHEFLRKS